MRRSVLRCAAEHRLHISELAPHGEGEGGHRALHPLQCVDAEELNKALLAVQLPEIAFAALQSGAVFLVIRLPLVRQDIAEGGIGGQVQSTDLCVDLAGRRELPCDIDVGFHVDRLETLGEATGLLRSVVLLQMSARTGDRKSIQEREVIEPQHLDETRRRAFGFVQIEPAVELLLREPGGAVDAGNAVIGQRNIVALNGKGNLVCVDRPCVC